LTRAATKYFKVGKRPAIAETVAYYRERKIGLVMFTVDSEFQLAIDVFPTQKSSTAARDNADIMIAFASIDPNKGMMGAREARNLIGGGIVKGFKFHPTFRGFSPYRLCQVIRSRRPRGSSTQFANSGQVRAAYRRGQIAVERSLASPARTRFTRDAVSWKRRSVMRA
jgi:predicted TIM-barrel fold metal-dependent hydrolase